MSPGHQLQKYWLGETLRVSYSVGQAFTFQHPNSYWRMVGNTNNKYSLVLEQPQHNKVRWPYSDSVHSSRKSPFPNFQGFGVNISISKTEILYFENSKYIWISRDIHSRLFTPQCTVISSEKMLLLTIYPFPYHTSFYLRRSDLPNPIERRLKFDYLHSGVPRCPLTDPIGSAQCYYSII